MSTPSPPATFKAWQFSSTTGGLAKNLNINSSASLPTPAANQHIVKIIATALNPVDYKPAEIPYLGRLITGKGATPCSDVSGVIIKPAANSSLKPGQLIFGVTGYSPIAGKALAQYALIDETKVAIIPQGVNPVEAAGVGIAGLTAYQTITPYVKEGDKVFINAGSGGTGAFGIQIAKALGCHVTTSCSTANVEFCRNLGAEEVIDYKKGDVAEQLIASGAKFNHVVDNVGIEAGMYWRCDKFTVPGASYVVVGGEASLSATQGTLGRLLRPGFLGGGKRKLVMYLTRTNSEDIAKIGELIREGKVKVVIDSKFNFEQAREAFDRLKTHRAKGKIIITVDSEADQKVHLNR